MKFLYRWPTLALLGTLVMLAQYGIGGLEDSVAIFNIFVIPVALLCFNGPIEHIHSRTGWTLLMVSGIPLLLTFGKNNLSEGPYTMLWACMIVLVVTIGFCRTMILIKGREPAEAH